MATTKSSTSKPAVAVPTLNEQERIKAFIDVLNRTLHSVSTVTNAAPFPNGITKICVALTLPGSTGITLDIEGPDHKAAPQDDPNRRGTGGLAPFAGKSIEEMHLAPHAKAGAQSLLDRFGDLIVFTSGRRTVEDQCRVMADNIVHTGDRKWIIHTYTNGGKELQDWVDAHSEATTRDALKTGLLSVMHGWDEAKQNMLSRHLTGAAFDMAPVTDHQKSEREASAADVWDAITQLPHIGKPLDHEGRVQVWHVPFTE